MPVEPRRRLVAGAAALVVISLAPLASVEARGLSRCASAGSKTIVASEAARVYRKGTTVYGCLYSVGRKFRLGTAEDLLTDVAYVSPIRLAGRFVAYSQGQSGRDGYSADLSVRDLRTGRIVRDWQGGGPGGRFGTEESYGVSDVVLKRNGSVAWLNDRSRLGDRSHMFYLYKSDADGDLVLLDSGPGIEPGSLALSSGSRVYWTHNGVPHSATLR
jgi:hypothetical protein